MCWYVFLTDWGWSGVRMQDGVLQKLILPLPSEVELMQYLDKDDQLLQLVSDDDTSIPVINKIRAYYKGEIIENWGVGLNLASLPPFSRKVLQYVYTIPYGITETYSSVARSSGSAKASRAVGQAMRINPIPLIIPCHRVLAKNGPGGFSALGGVETKNRMLAWEQNNLVNA